jgi:cell wall-associated NlpC family hydrolase
MTRSDVSHAITTAFSAIVGLVLLTLMTTLGSFPASAAPVTRDQAVNYVIARGLAQRGVPYSWGGGDITGPTPGRTDTAKTDTTRNDAANNGTVNNDTATNDTVKNDTAAGIVGFDASGLIQYVYAGVGAKLPRSSGAMYNVGQKVTPAQALPADLIFYGPDGADSVTMFLGNNQMLEVTDTGVAVSAVRTTGMAPYLVRIIA